MKATIRARFHAFVGFFKRPSLPIAKRCAVCDGKPIMQPWHDQFRTGPEATRYRVECSACRHHYMDMFKEFETAIAHWNLKTNAQRDRQEEVR